MKFKRSMITLLALLLVLCLSMSFLTACNDNVQETQPSTTTPLTTEPLTTEPEPTETEPEESPEEWTGFFANCFTGSLQDYEGEIDGVSFQGLLMNQPETVTLTKSAVKALRLFARANGFDGLRVHTYVTQADDTLVVNGVEMKREVWDSTEIHLGMLNSLTQFTSYTTDESENYMWFEFIKMPVINATSFVESVVPYQGTIGGITFDGFVFRSGDYQPTAYFTEDAVEDIKAYAKENGFNALRISSYPIQNEHFFNVGGYFCLLNTWTTRDYDVTKISSDFIFWSQGGSTENYMIFEFVNSNNPLRPYGKEGPPTPSHPYFTSTGKVAVEDYNGTIEGVQFKGYKFTSSDYQPTFQFTAKGVAEIKDYAKKNNVNYLKIHSYAILNEHLFVLNGKYTETQKWCETDVYIDSLTDDFTFWSQGTNSTEIYMWFEFYYDYIPEATSEIDASYFQAGIGGDGNMSSVTFADYIGKVGDTAINGIQIISRSYQPAFGFTAEGIAAIKAYAAANNVNYLKIHSYAILNEHFLQINGTFTETQKWVETTVYVDSLTEDFRFWSQGGSTEVYLWFEFYYEYVAEATSEINASYFQAGIGGDGNMSSVTFADYIGKVGDTAINGIQIISHSYQPAFGFTAEGIAAIKAYAAANNVNYLKIHSYAILNEHFLLINGKYTDVLTWTETDVFVDTLTEDYKFWSQAPGSTEIYFWFEFYYDYIPEATSEIDASYFQAHTNWNGDAPFNITFSDYLGAAGYTPINGVKVVSYDYQPSFGFTADGVAAIKAYAAEHNVNYLKIHSYAILNEHFLLINGKYTDVLTWTETDVFVDTLTEDYRFWSQAPGSTEVYLWFEFYYEDAPDLTSNITAQYFEGAQKNESFKYSLTFEDYIGEAGGTTINGVKVVSSDYQPYFKFTADGVAAIKAYAAEHNVNYLKIHSYAILNEHFLLINGTYTDVQMWVETEVDINTITEDFRFWSQAPGSTEIYFWFEYYRVDLINSDSFTSSTTNFSNYEGTVGGVNFAGVKATSSEANPIFAFTEGAVAEITAHADKYFQHTLKISVYPILENGQFKLGETNCPAGQWTDIEVNTADISSVLTFAAECTGNTEVYMMFTFLDDIIIGTGSFSGAFTAEEFNGVIGDEEIAAIKLSSTGRTRDSFTADALEGIKNYANKMGYTELKIKVYVTLDNNQFTVFGQSIVKDQWNEFTVSIDSLTTSSRIQTTSTGNTEAYFVFEFQ